jgi:uncharacterized protein (TIGR03435 family)
MTTRSALHTCLILSGAWLGRAQEFEAASIKPHTALAAAGVNERSGIEETTGLIRIENLSLKVIIEIAYGVKDYQFSGPDWLNAARFDIVAKPPAGYTKAQLQPLLRNLLAARFKLTVHHESKEVSGYVLLVSKGGHKLQESARPRGYFTGRPGLLSGNQVPMRELADILAGRVGRPVVDSTGLTARYDIKLEWTPDQAAPSPVGAEDRQPAEPGPSIFTALNDQLGLRLQAQKVPVDVVIVDHVEKTPTEN